MTMSKVIYIWPRQYEKDGQKMYALPKGGDKMGLGELKEVYDIVKQTRDDKDKAGDMWVMFFDTGYRVTNDNYDISRWSGHVLSDVDSKWYYKYCKKFDTKKVFNDICNYMKMQHNDNFYSLQFSNSETGYHIIWWFDCEKTEENFKKCTNLAFKWTRECFMSIGLEEVIDYKYEHHKVLDTCTNSIFQGCYISKKATVFGNISGTDFGKITYLDEITLEETVVNTFDKGNREYDYKGKVEVDKDKVPHLGHYQRRYAYEALIEIFKDKESVDAEWDKLCEMMPSGSHDLDFYKKEPDKHRWFDKFDSNVSHDVDVLKRFGYDFKCTTDYIYQDGFNKAWKKYLKRQIDSTYCSSDKYNVKLSELVGKIAEQQAKKLGILPTKLTIKQIEAITEKAANILREQRKDLSAFDKEYDNLGKAFNEETGTEIDLDEQIDKYRQQWKQDRWDYKRDFNHLVFPYDKKDDLTAYKMFADIYYRDKDNNPLLKYNVLEDDVLTYSYWFETDKMQWHTFKYNDEYTTWCNNDEYSNKMSKDKMTCAVNKYTRRWFTYHSIKEYLNSLDLSTANEELLETWAIRYFKADDTLLTRTISKNFFIAAVKKMMIEDPTKFVFQHMLLLHGKTGCGKTAFLVKMFTIDGHSYILNKLNPDDDDIKIGPLVAKNWLIQFGEGGKLNKVDVNAAKEFIDRINLGMKYQKKYENEQTTIYPRVVACRTSNDDILFNDISVDVDRRNWLIECRTEMNSCDEAMRKQMDEDKDILWATAYKLYLDNPDIDLELPDDLFSELGKIQEEHKLITQSDIKEIYDEIFDRQYVTNGEGFMIDEYSFKQMSERSDLMLESVAPRQNNLAVPDLLDDTLYLQRNKITIIPCKWLSNYIKSKYNNSIMKKLKDYLLENHWTMKLVRYNKKPTKCWVNENDSRF